MKSLRTRLLSVLLTLALLFSLSAPALAYDPDPSTTDPGTTTTDPGTTTTDPDPTPDVVAPESIALDHSTLTVYLHNGTPTSGLPLKATVAPEGFDKNSIVWSVDGAKVTVSPTSGDTTLVAAAAGAADKDTATVTATAAAGGTSRSASCAVTVKADTVKSSAFGPFTVEAGKTLSAVPKNVVWESGATGGSCTDYRTDNQAIASVDSQGKVTAHQIGKTKVYVKVDGVELAAEISVTGVTGITLNKTALSLSVGDAPVQLTATVAPAGLSYTPTFTSSDASIASVDAGGKVTAKKAGGPVTITAAIKDARGVEFKATCAVTVTSVNGDVSDTTNAAEGLSLKNIYAELASRYKKMGGGGNPTVEFSSLGNSSVGTLYETSDKKKAVDKNYYGSFSLLESMYFMPASAGRYVSTYTLTGPGGSPKLGGTITIEVTNAEKKISVSLGSGTDYRFSEADASGSTGVKLIADALGSYGSLRFGTVTSGSGTGTLYTALNGTSVRSGTVVNSGDVGELYFTAGSKGLYQIEYSAYSGVNAAGNLIAAGTLTIGASAESLNVTANLDEIAEYRFNSATRRDGDSVDALLRSAVNTNVGAGKWKYVKFDSAASANTCDGTLYTDSTKAYAVNANTFIASGDIARLFFVPARAGVFELGYGVYSDDVTAAPLASGKLRITVSNLSGVGNALILSTTTGGTIGFRDSDFVEWFLDQRSTNNRLEYVRFTGISRSYGTFYVGNRKLDTGYDYTYYLDGYYNRTDTGAHMLSDVSFLAPSLAGTQEVSFTCYGRGSGNAVVQNSGILRIYVTSGSVSDITCTYGNASSVPLKESDFASVYRNAVLPASSAAQTFYVQFLDTPAYGTLYETNGSGRTELTGNNVDRTPYYINGGAGTDSVSKLIYVPNLRGTGSYPVRYVAFAADGTELFLGRIVFKYDAETTVINVTDGYTFTVEDVFSETTGEKLLYVIFDQPRLGRLCLNYANGRGTLMPAGTKLYPSASNSDTMPVSALTYVPRSDMEGTMALGCTVYTTLRTYTNEIMLKIDKKTASNTFSDVTAADVGTWAGNAIDFASKWGLVIGTGDRKFSPANTMRRCDLVLILYRNAGSPAVNGITMPYTDVPADAYYLNSALWASKNGIMDGVVTANRYDPSGAITRQDFTRILYNYTRAMNGNLSGAVSLSNYTDADKIASYARDAMAWAVGRGYINGMSATTLGPGEKATRAQIATLLHRYLTL